MPVPIVVRLLLVWEDIFANMLTEPSFANLVVVLTGWVLTDAPVHTITEALLATGVAGRRHHERHHRLFSRGSWDPDRVGYWLVQRILKLAGPGAVRVVIDDTVAPKKGPHVFGLGTHVDAVRSTKRYRVFVFGHSLGGGKYILAARMRAGDEVTHEVLTRQGRYHVVADNLRVKEVIVGDGEARRRYVVCHNPVEEKRQREHRAQLLSDLKAELASLSTKGDQATTQRGRALLTSARFGRYLRQDRGRLRIDRAAVEQAGHYDGKWVVTSNDDTLTAEDLALGYKQLLRVEACWRTLKSGLRMRPVFHRLAARIQAHGSISVLALLLERIIEIRAGDTWRNVSAELASIKVIEYDRAGARIQQTTALRPATAVLLKTLGVEPPPSLHVVASAPQSSTSASTPPATIAPSAAEVDAL